MATATVILKDEENGRVDIEVIFDPPLDANAKNYSDAQLFAFKCLEIMKEFAKEFE